jgi:hypothetical protein
MKNDILKPVIIGIALALAATCMLAGLSLVLKTRLINIETYRKPVITKLAVPSITPTISIPTLNAEATQSIPSDELAIGRYVQISGTGNIGLRIRQTPGIDGTQKFIAMEKELFIIKDGPVEKDEFTWWLLVASYDENRQGWAAGQYLTVVSQP